MIAQHNPDEIARLIAEARERKEWDMQAHNEGRTTAADGYESADYVDGWNDALDAVAAPMADQLEAAQAEIARLRTRQAELLQTIVRVTNETPFPDEVKGWTEQRAKLVAEVGTLRSQLIEPGRTYQRDMSERAGAIMLLTAERDKLRLQLEARDAIIAAGERTIASGNEAFRTLREQWQAERDKLRADLADMIRNFEATESEAEQLRTLVQALRFDTDQRDKLQAELEAALREVVEMRPVVEVAVIERQARCTCDAEFGHYARCARFDVENNLVRAVDAYRVARDKAGG